jgi:hypothetical protein
MAAALGAAVTPGAWLAGAMDALLPPQAATATATAAVRRIGRNFMRCVSYRWRSSVELSPTCHLWWSVWTWGSTGVRA